MRNVPRTTGLLIAALSLGLFASSAFAIGPTSEEAAQNGHAAKAKVVYNADGSVSKLNRPKCQRGELPVVTGNHWTCKPAKLTAPEPEQTALLLPAVQSAQEAAAHNAAGDAPKCPQGQVAVNKASGWVCEDLKIAAPESEKVMLLPAVQKIREPAVMAESAKEQ